MDPPKCLTHSLFISKAGAIRSWLRAEG